MLDKLKPIKTKTKKRKGRGMSSGKGGHTVGRGQKGQKSRAGYSSPRPGFEGGAMPLSRRIPKLPGFSRGKFVDAKANLEISLDDLNIFKDGSKVNLDSLISKGLVSSKFRKIKVKVLANGQLDRRLEIEGLNLSISAKKAIEDKGGKVSK